MHKQSGTFQEQGPAVEPLRGEAAVQGQIIEGCLNRASDRAANEPVDRIAARRILERLDGAGLEDRFAQIVQIMLKREADAERPGVDGCSFGCRTIRRSVPIRRQSAGTVERPVHGDVLPEWDELVGMRGR